MRIGVKIYSPAASVRASCEILVSTLSNVTLAPAMTAPLASLTAPKMVPVSWARRAGKEKRTNNTPYFMGRLYPRDPPGQNVLPRGIKHGEFMEIQFSGHT